MTNFASAYRQLQPAEKAFVDAYVGDIEREANRTNDRISNALYRAIPAAVVDASRGMLDKPMVLAAITERINTLAAATELTVQRVVKELMAMGFSSVGDYMTIGQDGQPYFDMSRSTPEQLSAVQSVEYEETIGRMGPSRKFKFKLHDKLSAIDKLAKFIGMLDSDNQHWREANARPVAPARIGTDATVGDAADLYARAIGG